jgi:hypothetical protein
MGPVSPENGDTVSPFILTWGHKKNNVGQSPSAWVSHCVDTSGAMSSKGDLTDGFAQLEALCWLVVSSVDLITCEWRGGKPR